MKKQFRHVMLLSVAAIGSLMLASCSDSDAPALDGITDAPLERINLDIEQMEYVGNSASFSVKLWHAINAMPEYEKSNFIISPLSLQINLALLANGASDETLKTLTDVILPDCTNPSLAKLNELNSLLIEKLPQTDRNAKYKMANSVWHCIDMYDDYISRVNRYYNASVFEFDGATNEAKKAINEWLAAATDGGINEYLQNPPKEQVLFLSALQFKHGWTKKFEKSDTKLEDFYCESGEVVKVPMMCKVDELAEIRTHEKSMRAIVPFGNKAFTLHLIKPDEGYSVDEALEEFTKGEYYTRTLKLKMPRFSLETEIDFLDILCSMGLENAFKGTPDYSAMTSTDFEIRDFRQKSKLEVDEDGAVYKVVTSSGGVGDTALGPPPPIVEFYLDHPFAFEIHESSTGVIIAMGKVCNL